jgi:hypothetical protein
MSSFVETNAYLGKTITYADFKTKMKQLNQDIVFDERDDGSHIYYGTALGAARTGIWWKNDHICNIERIAAIPEFNIYGDPKEDVFPLTIEDCISDNSQRPDGNFNSYFYTVEVHLNIDPQTFLRLHRLIGNQMEMVAKRKDYTSAEILLERTSPLCITAYFALGYRTCSTKVIRIGWRHMFNRLVSIGIPGVTKENIRRVFNVTYEPNYRSDQQLYDEMRSITA